MAWLGRNRALEVEHNALKVEHNALVGEHNALGAEHKRLLDSTLDVVSVNKKLVKFCENMAKKNGTLSAQLSAAEAYHCNGSQGRDFLIAQVYYLWHLLFCGSPLWLPAVAPR